MQWRLQATFHFSNTKSVSPLLLNIPSTSFIMNQNNYHNQQCREKKVISKAGKLVSYNVHIAGCQDVETLPTHIASNWTLVRLDLHIL